MHGHSLPTPRTYDKRAIPVCLDNLLCNLGLFVPMLLTICPKKISLLGYHLSCCLLTAFS